MSRTAFALGCSVLVSVVGAADNNCLCSAPKSVLYPSVVIPTEFQEVDCLTDFGVSLIDIVRQRKAYAKITCGTLKVAKDYSRPELGTFDLAILHAQKNATQRGEHATIKFHGGPGGEALGSAAVHIYRYQNINTDFIVYDQRGCANSYNGVMDPPCSWQGAGSVGQECRKQLRKNIMDAGLRPEFFSETNNVKDVEAIRQFLGYKQLNLMGYSYGTVLAQRVMRLFPSSVRTALLDGVTDPGIMSFSAESMMWSQGKNYALVDQACNVDPQCSTMLRDGFTNTANALYVDLETSPRNFTVQGQKVTLNGLTFALAMNWFLFANSALVSVEWLPLMVSSLKENDPVWMKIIAWLGSVQTGEWTPPRPQDLVFRADPGEHTGNQTKGLKGPKGSTGAALWIGVVCEIFKGKEGEMFNPEICAEWPVEGKEENVMDTPYLLDQPTLVFTGLWDTQTPPRDRRQSLNTLTNAKAVMFPNAGHIIPLDNDCSQDIITSFIDSGSADDTTRGCLAFSGQTWATTREGREMPIHLQYASRSGISAPLEIIDLWKSQSPGF